MVSRRSSPVLSGVQAALEPAQRRQDFRGDVGIDAAENLKAVEDCGCPDER